MFSSSARSLGDRLAAFSRRLRGGRMTKWKGEAASYAPNLAQFVTCASPPALLAVALAAGLSTGPAAGQTLYWDGGTVNGGNSAADANGGAGTWSNTLTNWDTAATGGSSTNWIVGGDAVFGGSAGGTVTVDAGGVAAHSIFFARSGYVVDGGTITMTGASPTIGVSFNDSGTINSTIAGTNGLVTGGNGVLLLNGTNTFTGGLTVNGTLRLGGVDSANGANNVVRVTTGNTLQVATSTAFGNDTDASRLVLENLSVLTLLTAVTHDVTLAGAGTFTISGGTWTGGVEMNGNATLRFHGGMTVNGDLSDDDNGSVLSIEVTNGPSAVTFNGDLSHTGGLRVGDRAVLAGANTYSGATIVATDPNGTAMLTYTNTGAISANSNVVIGDADSVGLVQFGYSAADITLGTGGGQFRFAGDGGFLSSAVSAVDVALTLNAGAGLTWGAGNFIGDGDTLYLGTDRTNSGARELNLTNAIDLGAQQRTVFANQGNMNDHGVMSGILSGAGGGLQVVGNGLLELRGTNTYSGATEVQSTLMLGSAGALPGGIGVAGGQSNLQLNGVSGNYLNDGIVVLTAASGDFLRGTGTGGHQVQWLSDGGFTAVGGARTVNLGNGAPLTWGQGGFVGDGRRLVFGGGHGDSAINFLNAVALGSANRTIEVNNVAGNVLGLNLNGVISGSGALVLDGTGDVALTAANTFTGNAVLGSAIADDLEVTVATIGAAGTNGNLGAGGTIELRSHEGVLNYTGAGESNDRNWVIGGRNGATLFIDNDGTGALQLTGNITKDATGASNLLVLGGSFASTDGDSDGIADNPNIVSGVVGESSGTLNMQVNAGTWRFTGANTYNGSTLINTNAILEVDDLANGGAASSIGDSSNEAGKLIFVNNATLRYIGTGDSTDRLMTIQTGSRVESSGTGALHFTNTGLVAPRVGAGGYRLVLGGTNTDENTFAPTLTNMFPALDHGSSNLTFEKVGAGLWALTGNSNANANAYSGNTNITGGALKLNNAGAITGGLGVSSSHGATGSAERSSLIVFNGAAATAGVLGLTAASGPFTRGLTTAAGAFIDDNGTDGMQDDDNFLQGVRWTGSGGFAAWSGTQTVNIGGNATPDTLTWGAGGFVPSGHNLVFGYATADGTVDFRNPVSLGAAARTVEVKNGTAAVDAVMSGVLSSTTAAGALVKIGEGTLALTAANTYAGTTTINAGTLQIGNGGATGTLGGGSVALALAATVAFDRNNAYNVTNQFIGAGSLVQKGSGTTTIASAFNVVGATTISAGTLQLNGTMSTATITMTGTSALTVNGVMGATAGGIATFLGDAGASTITVAAGATLRGSGDLGGGSDTFSLTGTLNSGAGTLDLGDGSDTFVLNGNGTFTSVNGGAGTDTLTVSNSAARTLDATSATSFEALNKTLAGTLTLTGNHSYSAGTSIAGGTVQVGNGATAGTLTTPTVANSGTLTFNLDTDYSFSGAISGSGAVTKLGTGITTLTGANSYGGLTNVNAGALLINGNQTGATGMANVASGAVLGGSGTIGGSVTVAGGARLTAGGVGSDPETLAIRGNLTLQSGAIVSIDLGEADAVGGPLNDLITVGGNLTLDGTLDITEPAGGDFGPGVYRLFNYGGSLFNNGLDTGSPERFVQTTVPGQVNLINAAGLQLTFWDGDAGPKFNGAIDGGSGTWLAAGDQNWTDADGVFNAPFDNGAFAIFQGAPGIVTVSNANGQVETAGMNFAVSGYEIAGQPLTLVGSSAIIKVGVGSSAGSGMVATIRSVLQGTAQLVKTDMGTLVLTNDNTYSGGTAINGGTLEIGGDGRLGDLGGALSLNGGRLRTTDTFTSNRLVTLQAGGGTFETASATTLTLSNIVDGAGALTKTGAGTLVLGGANIYAGGTFLNGGRLQVAADANLGDAEGGLTFNGGRLHSTASFASDRLVTLNSDGGTFETDDLTTLTLTNAVGGTGRLRKDGDGTLVLTGTGSYSGGTTILAGTLQLGDGNASGSITGAVTNNGTLAFNRSDAYTFAGVISGTGIVEQRGGGITILTAANTYTGATNVLAGVLYINGNQTAAVGPSTVTNGAGLGGIGTIGGNVDIVDGSLNPGSTGIAPGTLTIKGNLTLTADAELNYNFGQANVPGGPYNDLTIVDGNLVLDGVVNVTETAGGNFGPGIYRIISYGGALANLGLTDNSPDYSVQTSIATQVNLVNTTGVTLNFWDGPGGASGDLDIRGGDGDWRLADNDDWTDETGFFNGNYLDGSFAVFAGEAGTVNVDNTNGQVQAAGMQFAVDGYRLVGGPLVLTGPFSTIRVGDGAEPGIEYTATIDAVLDGDAALVKTDRGTLVLTGNNTYRGGTVFRGGTVEISSDANLGDAAGGLSFDGGVLHTTASFEVARSFELVTQGGLMVEGGTTLTLAGKISGTGTLAKLGEGAIVYNSDSSDFTGTTLVENGLLTVNGSLCGDINILAGGRLQGTGTVCDTTNAGTVAPGNSIGTLTVAGDYAGTGGTLEMETVLGGDASPTDRLVITGNTSGTTNVRIINLGGTGAQTTEGIRIVQVGGASNGTFTLLGDYVFEGRQAVVAGAYAYRLYKNGVSTPNDGDWYLRSTNIYATPDPGPLYAPGVPIYETYGYVLLEFSDLGTMHERLGNRSWQLEQGSSAGDRRTGLWARVRGFGGSFEPEISTSSAGYDLSTWKFEAGADMQFAETAAGAFLGGVVLHYGTLSADIASVFGSGEIGGNGYGVGATLTWLGDDGFYVDAQAQVTWFNSDLTSTTASRSLVTGNDGVGYALSVEAGKRFVIGDWAITPQAQLGWASVDFDDFTDVFGAGVSLREGNALRGRIGLTLEREGNWLDAGGRTNRWRIYGIANLYNDFGDGTTVEVSGTPFFSKNDSLWGGLGLGGSLGLADDKYAVYGQALAKTSLENFGESNVISGTVGFRIRW